MSSQMLQDIHTFSNTRTFHEQDVHSCPTWYKSYIFITPRLLLAIPRRRVKIKLQPFNQNHSLCRSIRKKLLANINSI